MNYKHFLKYRDIIFKKFNLELKWFGFWIDKNGQECTLVNQTMEGVSVRVPLCSIISYGTSSEYIFNGLDDSF